MCIHVYKTRTRTIEGLVCWLVTSFRKYDPLCLKVDWTTLQGTITENCL